MRRQVHSRAGCIRTSAPPWNGCSPSRRRGAAGACREFFFVFFFFFFSFFFLCSVLDNCWSFGLLFIGCATVCKKILTAEHGFHIARSTGSAVSAGKPYACGGILADDMGLGKTLTTVAMCLVASPAPPREVVMPQLIVCPLSTIDHWEKEIRARVAGPVSGVCYGDFVFVYLYLEFWGFG
jgi:hypothetical protein